MREVQALLKASVGASMKLSLMALLVSASACGSTDPIVGDGIPRSENMDPATVKTDGGTKKSDAGKPGSNTKDSGTGTGTGPGADTGTGTAGDPTCGKSGFTTGAVIPDMLIALDRSGSMKPGGVRPGLRCDNIAALDFVTFAECLAANVDCARPADQMTVYCGGTQPKGPIDRWTPSVAAVKTLTAQFDQKVAFGLMTFPARSNECGPGDLKVPLGIGTAAEIADVLSNTDPGGGTPTGETLEAALELFRNSPVGAESVAPLRYVLLVTDGQPTCPNSNGGGGRGNALAADKKYTLDALDKLREAGIKTFVVGYDAALDDNLAQSLTEFAQHGGTDDYYPVQDEQSLVNAFQTISDTVAACAFEFKKKITDPRLIKVMLDGKLLRPVDSVPVDPNGWSIEGNTITVEGSSCQALQGGDQHSLEISIECEPVVYL